MAAPRTADGGEGKKREGERERERREREGEREKERERERREDRVGGRREEERGESGYNYNN